MFLCQIDCIFFFFSLHFSSFANFFSIFVLFHCSPFPPYLYTTICSLPLTHPSILFLFIFLLSIRFHVIVTLPSLSFLSYSSHPSVSFFSFFLLSLFSFISPSPHPCYTSPHFPFSFCVFLLSDDSAFLHLIHVSPPFDFSSSCWNLYDVAARLFVWLSFSMLHANGKHCAFRRSSAKTDLYLTTSFCGLEAISQ